MFRIETHSIVAFTTIMEYKYILMIMQVGKFIYISVVAWAKDEMWRVVNDDDIM